HLQAPIIVTFRTPADPRFAFEEFYDRLLAKRFAIYPGKLTAASTFRIGCIGRITPQDMGRAVDAVAATLGEPGPARRAPAAARSSPSPPDGGTHAPGVRLLRHPDLPRPGAGRAARLGRHHPGLRLHGARGRVRRGVQAPGRADHHGGG